MDRHQRLTELLQFINDNGDREYNFDKLYDKLIDEYHTEEAYNSNLRENSYLNNLRQTRDKQAATYIRTKQKRPKGNCYPEFEDFVSNFEQDVREGLRLHIKPSSDTTVEDEEV